MKSNYLKSLTTRIRVLLLAVLCLPLTAMATSNSMESPTWTDFAEQATVSTSEATADVYLNADTYTINSEKGLAWLAGVVNGTVTEGDHFPADTTFAGKTFKLGADLDLGKDDYKDLSWEPIGKNERNYFKGNFDGQMHTIKGLWIEKEVQGNLNIGLFGVVENCTLSNLHIQLSAKGIKVKVDVDNTNILVNVAAFIGEQDESVLENCYLTAEEGGKIAVEASATLSVGGMVGNATTIKNCYTTVPVSGTTTNMSLTVGGICAIANTELSNCYATGLVEAYASNTWGCRSGGICGITRKVLTNNLALSVVRGDGVMVNRITPFANQVLSNNYASTLTAGTWTKKGADNMDGADTDASSFWDNLNGEANNWSAYVKDANNVNLPKLAGDWSQPQPDLAIADYLDTSSPRITFSQSEVGGVLIVKDSLGKAITSDTLLAKNNVLTLQCLPLAGYQLKAFKANGTEVEANADSIFAFTVIADVAFSAEFEPATTPASNGIIYAAESVITAPVTTPAVVATADNLAGITDFTNVKLITGNVATANRDTLADAITASGVTYKETGYQEISLVEESLLSGSKITLPVQLKDGESVTLYLPYPAGTDKDNSFAVYHLNWKGEVETFSTKAGNLVNTANGLKLIVNSFSPFAIAYEEKEEPTPPPYVPTYYTVTLPEVEGATTDKTPGDYTIEEYESFSFSLELKDGYKSSVPVVKANGEVLKRRQSDGKYLLSFVCEDTEITIDGIVKDAPTSIDEVNNAIRVRTAASTLYINTPSEETVYIFNTSGIPCHRPLKVAGDAQIQLPAGFYLVKIAGKTYKVVVR